VEWRIAPQTHLIVSGARGVVGWLANLSDAQLVALAASALFVLAAWPLLLVELPPLQDLPNHVATAHIVAHPDRYPEYAFNGLWRSNALLTLWFLAWGGQDLFVAARLFVAVVLAVTALALPTFLLHFRGRRGLWASLLFAWPLVHSFSIAMGFLNFAFAFALSLILATAVDRQRDGATLRRGIAIAALSVAIWYAHPFPLAVVGVLVTAHVVMRPTWRARARAASALLLPILPAGLLCVVVAYHHLVKARGVAVAGPAFRFLNPWETLAHLWTDASGAFTWYGSMTVVPALLLPWFAWKGRRAAASRLPLAALAGLGAAYLLLPEMLSNWCYFNCRLVPYLWAVLLVWVPREVPRPVAVVLAGCALAFSAATGIDYARLDHDRAQVTAGMNAVPRNATLLPLMFKRSQTSTFTASLTHAWAYYAVRRDTSAPLAFAVERSYPITYRQAPPRALVPPALDRFAELRGTAAQVCSSLGRPAVDAGCTAAWRDLWAGFWRDAEPRFTHLMVWGIPPEARAIIPDQYQRIFSEGDLEIYARCDMGGLTPCAGRG
jgi:hypothetical protein